MSVLFFHTMKYKPDNPRNPSYDRFVLSKVTDIHMHWINIQMVNSNIQINNNNEKTSWSTE